jgi:ATP-binding cassette subfamily B (MDR/TAP) protein 1
MEQGPEALTAVPLDDADSPAEKDKDAAAGATASDDDEPPLSEESLKMTDKEFRRRCYEFVESSDYKWMLCCVAGALLAGLVFPFWGWVFALTLGLLFRPVIVCPDALGLVPAPFLTCQAFWDSQAADMQNYRCVPRANRGSGEEERRFDDDI